MTRLTKRERELHQLIEEEGAEVLSAGVTGKAHLKLKLGADGRKTTMISARSPSDFRAVRNARAFVRRFVRGQAHG